MSDKPRVVTMTNTYHSESNMDSDGVWTMTFYGHTPGGQRIQFKIELRRWWARFIARNIWAVIASEKKAIAEAEEAMRGPQ